MEQLRYALINGAFQILSISGLSRIIRYFSSCKGVIFALHRVLPDKFRPFQPNSILQITPEFLEQAILAARDKSFDIISLEEARERIIKKEKQNRFVVFSFDDAYRDNLTYALPILRRHNCPFSLFVPINFVEGKGVLWWQLLEDIIRENNRVIFANEEYLTESLAQKHKSYYKIYWLMRSMEEEKRMKETGELAAKYNIDTEEHCKKLIMNWQELEIFANEPLCTIGAHTVNHYELNKLSLEDARWEMLRSREILEEKFGKRPAIFSYPLGTKRSAAIREYELAKELGFAMAVTTNPGGLYQKHQDQLHQLPRISLNGLFQKKHYLDVFFTGAIFGR